MRPRLIYTPRLRCVVSRVACRMYQRLGAWLDEHGWFYTWVGQRLLDITDAFVLCDGHCDGGCP